VFSLLQKLVFQKSLPVTSHILRDKYALPATARISLELVERFQSFNFAAQW